MVLEHMTLVIWNYYTLFTLERDGVDFRYDHWSAATKAGWRLHKYFQADATILKQ